LRSLRAHVVSSHGDLDVQHLVIQEEESAQRLILGRGRHLSGDGEPAEETR
jgi:hypothetical protein